MHNLFDRLEKLQIKHTLYTHKPLFTSDEANAEYDRLAIPNEFGRCKNLFLKDSKKRFWLIVALYDTQIKLKELSKTLQAPELRFADETFLMHYLGVKPGSVTPFGLINDAEHAITVVIDDALLKKARVGFHPLSNDATLFITPADLFKFIADCGNRMLTGI